MRYAQPNESPTGSGSPREWSLPALGRDTQALSEVYQAAQNKDWAAVAAWLNDSNPVVAEAAENSLIAADPCIVSLLLDGFNQLSEVGQNRAINVIQRLDRAALEVLLDNVNHSDPIRSGVACSCLAAFPDDPKCVKTVLTALNSPEQMKRFLTLLGVQRKVDDWKAAKETLIPFLRENLEHRWEQIQLNAARILLSFDVRDREVSEALERLNLSKDREIVEEANLLQDYLEFLDSQQ